MNHPRKEERKREGKEERAGREERVVKRVTRPVREKDLRGEMEREGEAGEERWEMGREVGGDRVVMGLVVEEERVVMEREAEADRVVMELVVEEERVVMEREAGEERGVDVEVAAEPKRNKKINKLYD